jgi:hypothetical protein
MVRALSAFLDFCYLVRRDVLDEDTLDAVDEAIARYHRERTIFQSSGVRPTGFSLPRQHSLVHYRSLIELFGAPNGLCSSITESKHIKAVKEPWRRSGRFEALGQMLLTNQRIDKLGASRADFQSRGLLTGAILAPHLRDDNPEMEFEDLDDVVAAGPRIHNIVTLAKTRGKHSVLTCSESDMAHSFVAPGYPRYTPALALHIGQPNLMELIRRFLFDQLYPDAHTSDADISLD